MKGISYSRKFGPLRVTQIAGSTIAICFQGIPRGREDERNNSGTRHDSESQQGWRIVFETIIAAKSVSLYFVWSKTCQ